MTPPAVAVLIRGPATAAAVTVRAVRATAGVPVSVYLVLEPHPAEAFNRAAAVRTESHLLFLDGGLSPSHPDWLARMLARLDRPGVGGVVGTLATETGALAGLLVTRDTFDLLGGFDADRHPDAGFTEDFLARLLGFGLDCVAADGVEFLAGTPQLRRAG